MAEKKELAVTEEKVVEIEMERLRSFENHPFKVKADSQMIELQESVKKYGILNPLFVRPRKDGTYEIISGHRRKFAAEKIASNRYPAELVRSKFLKLKSSHIEYAIDCFKSNTTKVRNIKKYLLTTLFNAPSTISGYYQAVVNHDFPQYAVIDK